MLAPAGLARRALANGFLQAASHQGDPFQCAVALANLDVLEHEGLLARATATGELLGRRLAELEHSVRARDETIAGLEESLRQHERAEGELLAQKNDLAERAAALERSLSQRQDVLKLAVERGVQKERDFRNGQQRITRLEGLLREAAHEIDELFTAVEEQEKTISRLETHLHGEQDGSERNGQYADRDRRLVSVDGPTRGH